MKTFNLNIACYNIRFESSSGGPDIIPSERFIPFITLKNDPDILIRVHSGGFELPFSAKKVFDAPYINGLKGMPEKNDGKFWSIYRKMSDFFIITTFPLSPDVKKAVLCCSLISREWDLWIGNGDHETDPMEYPLDGLLLYYLTVIHGDILIHASGINNAGTGYVFSGISGKGKTTMADIWKNAGARVIHDDRLILHDTGSGYIMYNTPVYKNDNPSESKVNKIFLIAHGERNEIIPVKEAAAVSQVMANCIQHNWDREIIAQLLGSISIMCAVIPVARLHFRPDRNIIDAILENE